MDESRYTKHLAWRKEVERRWQTEMAPPIASMLPTSIDVAAIREKLGRQLSGWPLSQEAFAARFGIPFATVRDWEQGRRRPDAAARVLLLTIANNPAAVDVALQVAVDQDQPAPWQLGQPGHPHAVAHGTCSVEVPRDL